MAENLGLHSIAFSDAEVFVFIAGYAAATVYGKAFEGQGCIAAVRLPTIDDKFLFGKAHLHGARGDKGKKFLGKKVPSRLWASNPKCIQFRARSLVENGTISIA